MNDMAPEALTQFKQVVKEEIEAVSSVLISQLRDAGLVLVPNHFAKYAYDYEQKRKQLMKKRAVTLVMAEKYKLVDKATARRTLKTMIKDGRLTQNENFKDAKGVSYITTAGIRRLNGLKV